MHLFLSAILGYVFGSVPFGLLLTKAAGLGDVRNIGSGNIGATNVLRTGNKPIAIATLLCDVLKAQFQSSSPRTTLILTPRLPLLLAQWQGIYFRFGWGSRVAKALQL